MSLAVALRHRLADFQLDVAFDSTSGVTALFGPSGAGKSSVAKMVAGLLRAETGLVRLGDTVLQDSARGIWIPPEQRRIGVVFQDARLFPHMSVADNLRFGARRAPVGPIRFDDVLALLGIAGLLDRRPHTLSGGERQRVAIGRALMSQPALLVMDEPLASLDSARKQEILPYLHRLKQETRLPVLYVSHALDEIIHLADTLVLIEAGRVTEAGDLESLSGRADLPLALRDDAAGLMSCVVAGHDPARRLSRLAAGGYEILVPLLGVSVGSRVRLRIPAREVILARIVPEGISLHNILPCSVRDVHIDHLHHAALVAMGLGESAGDDAPGLLARVTPDAVQRLGLAPGESVLALVKSMSVEVVPQNI